MHWHGDTLAVFLGVVLIFALTALAGRCTPHEYHIPQHNPEEDPMFRPLAVMVALPGTISADAEFYFKAPCDLTLRAVSAGADNAATTTTINVGTTSDEDGYIDAKAIGQSDAPSIWDLDDFNGALVTNAGDDYPQISAGTVISVGIDVGDGTDPIDPCIVLWFEEG